MMLKQPGMSLKYVFHTRPFCAITTSQRVLKLSITALQVSLLMPLISLLMFALRVLLKLWETACRLGPLGNPTSKSLTDSSQVSAEATRVFREITRSSNVSLIQSSTADEVCGVVPSCWNQIWSSLKPFLRNAGTNFFSGNTDNVHCLLFLHARPGPRRKMVR